MHWYVGTETQINIDGDSCTGEGELSEGRGWCDCFAAIAQIGDILLFAILAFMREALERRSKVYAKGLFGYDTPNFSHC